CAAAVPANTNTARPTNRGIFIRSSSSASAPTPPRPSGNGRPPDRMRRGGYGAAEAEDAGGRSRDREPSVRLAGGGSPQRSKRTPCASGSSLPQLIVFVCRRMYAFHESEPD